MFAGQPQEPRKCQELQQTAGYMTSAGQLLVPRKSPVRQLQEVGCRMIAEVPRVPRKSPERLQRAKDCKTSGERPLVLRKSPEERRAVLVGSCMMFEEQLQLVPRKSFVELLEEHHSQIVVLNFGAMVVELEGSRKALLD